MRQIVVADIGGTHARFGIAEIDGGRVTRLHEPVTLRTADHASLRTAWRHFVREVGGTLPSEGAMAFAGPVDGDLIKLTNNPWVIKRASLGKELELPTLTVINDFGAVAHAVATLADSSFASLCGPDIPLPREGVISIVGPGTGLGVAQLLRRGGRAHIIETEGGHIGFAPTDDIEDAIVARLRARHGRVSAERIVCGAGLADLVEALTAIDGPPAKVTDHEGLWAAAISGRDDLAGAALDRYCMCLGAIAGDIALAHGAAGVVIAGGLGHRLADYLPASGFAERFAAKGRFDRRMAAIPVKLISHPQPGLLGAAAAFAAAHPQI